MGSKSERKSDPTEEYEASEPYRLPGIANLHAFVIYYCPSNMSWTFIKSNRNRSNTKKQKK